MNPITIPGLCIVHEHTNMLLNTFIYTVHTQSVPSSFGAFVSKCSKRKYSTFNSSNLHKTDFEQQKMVTTVQIKIAARSTALLFYWARFKPNGKKWLHFWLPLYILEVPFGDRALDLQPDDTWKWRVVEVENYFTHECRTFSNGLMVWCRSLRFTRTFNCGQLCGATYYDLFYWPPILTDKVRSFSPHEIWIYSDWKGSISSDWDVGSDIAGCFQLDVHMHC